MSERTMISWNAMIAGCAQAGYSDKALEMFSHMQQAGVKPDAISIAGVLPACTHMGALQQGYAQKSYDEEAVSLIRQMQLVGSKLVSVTITNFLPACAHLASLHLGYAQNSQYTKSLELFSQMEQACMEPDPVSILSILLACAHLSALRQGKEIHNYIIRHAYELHVFVSNSLLDVYVKCGNIDTTKLLFDRIPQRDVASWNTMIAGYAIQGHSKTALKLFHKMQPSGLKPNHIPFIAVLSACSRVGLVEEGWQYFDCMCQSYITPQREHYACMVDLLGRAGQLNEALDFINKMPFEPDPNLCGPLLAACRIHCHIELGERVAEHLFEVVPENTGYYVPMSNIYAASGRWDDLTKVRKLMEDRGLKKKPGWSWIEVNGKVYPFLVGDRSHPQSENIYAILKSLSLQMEEAGYVPDTRFVLYDIEEDT